MITLNINGKDHALDVEPEMCCTATKKYAR